MRWLALTPSQADLFIIKFARCWVVPGVSYERAAVFGSPTPTPIHWKQKLKMQS